MTIISSKKNTTFSAWFTASIVAMPILNAYEIPFPKIGLGEFLLFILTLLGAVDLVRTWRKEQNPFESFLQFLWNMLVTHRYFVLFLLYSCLISAVAYFFTPSYSIVEILGRLSRHLFYGFIILVFVPVYFNSDKGVKFYRGMAIVALGYLLVQFFLFKFGYMLFPNFIQGPLQYTIRDALEYRDHVVNLSVKSFRPLSFFLEPSYYGEYIVPFIGLSLVMGKKSRKTIILLALLTFSVLLTKSANGLAYLMVVFAFALFYFMFTIKFKDKWLYFTIFVLLGLNVLVLLYYTKNTYLSYVISRFTEVGMENGNTSGNIRVLRGFMIYGAMGLLYKIIGFGFGNYNQFAADHHLVTITDKYVNNADYMSGFTQILTSGGVIGTMLFLAAFVDYNRKAGVRGWILTLVFSMMMLSSTVYGKPVYLIVMAFLVSFALEKDPMMPKENIS